MSETLEQPQTFSIEKLEATQLPELQGLKEKQMQIVKENPFIEITDNTTFEVAKKSRTNLVSARTDIEKQDKLIASKIKKFREMVSGVSEELISITKPHEEKQQDEVKRYEAIKEAEKAEKARLEEERKAKIKSAIDAIYNDAISRINHLNFISIEGLKTDLEENIYKTETDQFEEFELDFNEKLNLIKSQFSSKEKQLTELENQRIEAENLKAEREKLEADRKALEEKQAVENARIAKEKADAEAKLEADKKALEDQQKTAHEKLEADRLKIENEQKEVQQKLDAERAEIEADKAKIAKVEADKKAQELKDALAIEKSENDRIADEKAKEDARINAEKQEALKPEKEKAIDFLNCLVFKNEFPEIKDAELLNHVENFINEIEQKRNDLIKFIQTI